MGSFPTPSKSFSSLPETSCGYLLQELKLIWDEVGQEKNERQKVLLELEQECLEIYKRKVDKANVSRSRLHQLLADSEAELAHLLVCLGERSLPRRPEKVTGTLKEQLDSITPALQEIKLRKEERVKQFLGIQMQIQRIQAEIAGESEIEISTSDVKVNENDLSLKKLEEYQVELQQLQKNKNDRLLRVEGYVTAIHKLSKTLGMDSTKIITKIHPSLVDVSFGQKSKSISDAILAELNSAVESLEEEKHERLQKIHELGRALENLWSLMEMNYEDRKSFSHVKDLLSFSADEIFSPGSLAPDIIHQAEAEVERLDQLKASKMKELFFKKQTELMDICKRTHMEMPSQSEIDTIMNLINSGDIGHDDLLKSMDEQILRVKEEASSREPIIEKVEKWIISRDEERWLEEYNRDENRYSVRRGAHKNLKRAERARIIVSKIPALVDQLIENTRSWEEERKKVFLYDQVPLLEILEEYNLIRQESEEEKQKQREKKRMQLRVAVAQENLFTSSSRLSNGSINGGFGSATPLNRRFSMGVQHQGSKSIHSASKDLSFMMENKKAKEQKIPAQKSLHLRDSRASVMSATYSSPLSP